MAGHSEPPTDEILRQQIDYYRHRSAEYDEWFQRQGRYDRGDALNKQWFDEVAELEKALDDFRPAGRVLEFACGTGWWTQRLAKYADSLTAIDASPEVIEINRRRLGPDATRVQYVQSDIFRWRPAERYDVAFFSFWLSHVPPEKFEPFWDVVRSSLAPAGRVFFIDSAYTQTSTAKDHSLEGPDASTMTRRLNDGREYRIVKVFYDPSALQQRLESIGWQATVRPTPTFFIHGSAHPSPSPSKPGQR